MLLLGALVLLVAGGVAACGGDDDSDGDASAASSSVALAEQGGSGMSGSATITETDGGQLEVVVTLDGDDGSSARPAHIHAGSCEELGDVAYGLTDVTDGSSSSSVDATLAELEDGDFAINVHESADAIENYVACGPIG